MTTEFEAEVSPTTGFKMQQSSEQAAHDREMDHAMVEMHANVEQWMTVKLKFYMGEKELKHSDALEMVEQDYDVKERLINKTLDNIRANKKTGMVSTKECALEAEIQCMRTAMTMERESGAVGYKVAKDLVSGPKPKEGDGSPSPAHSKKTRVSYSFAC